MASLTTALRKRLNDAGRVAVLCIGSQFRGDDICGLLVADNLKKCAVSRSRRLKVLFGGTAPENLTGTIRKFKPGHIILVDAADFGKKTGTVRLINPDEAHGVCFCTHQLPLKILSDYLTQSIGCGVTIIGIQAKTLDFGSAVSPAMENAARGVARDIAAALEFLRK